MTEREYPPELIAFQRESNCIIRNLNWYPEDTVHTTVRGNCEMMSDKETLPTLQDIYPKDVDIVGIMDSGAEGMFYPLRQLDALRKAHSELVFEQDPDVSFIINVSKKK